MMRLLTSTTIIRSAFSSSPTSRFAMSHVVVSRFMSQKQPSKRTSGNSGSRRHVGFSKFSAEQKDNAVKTYKNPALSLTERHNMLSTLMQTKKFHIIDHIFETCGGAWFQDWLFFRMVTLHFKYRNPGKAFQYLREAIAHNHKPDAAVYYTIVEYFATKGDVKAAESILQVMSKKGVEPSSMTWMPMLHGAFVSNDLDKAIDIFNNLIDSENQLSHMLFDKFRVLAQIKQNSSAFRDMVDRYLEKGLPLDLKTCRAYFEEYRPLGFESFREAVVRVLKGSYYFNSARVFSSLAKDLTSDQCIQLASDIANIHPRHVYIGWLMSTAAADVLSKRQPDAILGLFKATLELKIQCPEVLAVRCSKMVAEGDYSGMHQVFSQAIVTIRDKQRLAKLWLQLLLPLYGWASNDHWNHTSEISRLSITDHGFVVGYAQEPRHVTSTGQNSMFSRLPKKIPDWCPDIDRVKELDRALDEIKKHIPDARFSSLLSTEDQLYVSNIRRDWIQTSSHLKALSEPRDFVPSLILTAVASNSLETCLRACDEISVTPNDFKCLLALGFITNDYNLARLIQWMRGRGACTTEFYLYTCLHAQSWGSPEVLLRNTEWFLGPNCHPLSLLMEICIRTDHIDELKSILEQHKAVKVYSAVLIAALRCNRIEILSDLHPVFKRLKPHTLGKKTKQSVDQFLPNMPNIVMSPKNIKKFFKVPEDFTEKFHESEVLGWMVSSWPLQWAVKPSFSKIDRRYPIGYQPRRQSQQSQQNSQ